MKNKNFQLIIALLAGLLFAISMAFLRTVERFDTQNLIRAALAIATGFAIRKTTLRNRIVFFLPLVYIYIDAFVFAPSSYITSLLELFFTVIPLALGYYTTSLSKKIFIVLFFMFSIVGYYLVCVSFPAYLLKNYTSQPSLKKVNIDNYTISDISGNEILLSSIVKNKTILIDFSFLQCSPCRAKLQPLNQLALAFKQDSSVCIFRLVDGAKNTKEEFIKYYSEHKGDLPIYYDKAGLFCKDQKIDVYPTEFILDKTNIIRSTNFGYSDYSYQGQYVRLTKDKINSLK